MTKFLNISTDNTLGGNAPSDVVVSSQKAIKDYVDQHGGGGADIDNSTITTNAQSKIQAVATINKNAASGATNPIYDWVGTLQQYLDLQISTTHPEWICYITDDEDAGDSVYTKDEVDVLVGERVLTGHELVASQVPTSENNYTWYRKYADGWVEQGGTDSSASEDLSVTLPVTMADDKYQVQLTLGNTTRTTFANQYWSTFGWRTKSTTGFTCTVNVANAGTKDWYVCGVAA